MHSILLGFAVTGLATFTHAFTKPGANTWGPLLTPDLTSPVTQGATYTITWDPETHPTDGVTVSLVLCHGPSTNCVTADEAIVEGVPAGKKSYEWSVPKDLAPGTQLTDTGYGMLIIVDGTGEFQYSTQFSVLAAQGSSGSGSSTTSGASKPPTTTSSSLVPISTDSQGGIVLGPPAYATGSSAENITTTTFPAGTTTKSGSHTTISGGASPQSTSDGSFSFGSGSTSAAGGTTLSHAESTSSGSTATGGNSRTTTASASGVTASTFQGAASRLSFSVVGLLAVGAAAVFVL